jgi:tetratricopeptide (TPR) repeat protein
MSKPNNLGLVLVDLGRAEEAIASYEQALRLRPTDVDLHSNIGTAFAAAGRHDEALASYEVALLLEPNHPETHWHRALSLLEIGNFADGWQEYEWRWKRKRANSRSLPKPLWSGDSLKDQTILLYCEQGLGDTLQFVRYARLVKERIGTVVLECPASMISLLSTCPGIDRLVAEGDPLPDFDVQAPLMSLPGILKVTRPLGASAPYVGADPDLTRSWCEELGKYDGVKVGIAWQGNPKHRWDRHRSLPLRQFLPLTRVPGIRLFSLQKGFGTEQLEQVESEARLIDLGNRIDPAGGMTDAAAVIQSLDLIVTCDSALAHLAAALGKPTWILIAHRSDWRWLRDREDSPWYSSVRLFRQKSPGDWQEVMGRVVSAAADLVAGGSTPEPIQVDHGHGKYTYTSSPAQSGSEISCANHARTDDTLRKAHHRRETGELQQAAFLYRKALHENPEHAGAYFHLGEILRKTKDLDEAAFQFREAIKRQPAFAEAQLLLADTLHEQKKADEAIHWYRRFLELRPDQPDAHNHLGILLAERGLYDEAIPHFQTLIKLQPDRIGAYHNIAVALADQGKLDVPLPEMFAVLAA